MRRRIEREGAGTALSCQRLHNGERLGRSFVRDLWIAVSPVLSTISQFGRSVPTAVNVRRANGNRHLVDIRK